MPFLIDLITLNYFFIINKKTGEDEQNSIMIIPHSITFFKTFRQIKYNWFNFKNCDTPLLFLIKINVVRIYSAVIITIIRISKFIPVNPIICTGIFCSYMPCIT